MKIPFREAHSVIPERNVTHYGKFDVFVEKYYPFTYTLLGNVTYLVQLGVIHDYGSIIHTAHMFSAPDNPSVYDVLNHIQYVYKRWRYAQVAVISRGIINDLVKHELSYLFEEDELDDIMKRNYDWLFMYAQLMTKEIQFLNHTPRGHINPIIADVYEMLCFPPHNVDGNIKLPYKENWKC